MLSQAMLHLYELLRNGLRTMSRINLRSTVKTNRITEQVWREVSFPLKTLGVEELSKRMVILTNDATIANSSRPAFLRTESLATSRIETKIVARIRKTTLVMITAWPLGEYIVMRFVVCTSR